MSACWLSRTLWGATALSLVALTAACDRPAPHPPGPPAAVGTDTTDTPTGESNTSEASETSAAPEELGPAAAVMDLLPFVDRANSVLVDDLDGDGLQDIVLTSHGGNIAIPFRQLAPRRFESGPEIEFIGFHPNDILRLPFGDGDTFMINAEGESELRFFTFDANLNATLDGQVKIAFPRYSTLFSWPGWGDSLAVTPYSGGHMTLLKGFDGASYNYDEQIKVDISPSAIKMPWRPAVADLDGDGIDELVYAVPKDRTVQVLKWTGEDTPPAIEILWRTPDRGTPHYVLPAHLDEDGRIDLIVVGNTLKAVHLLLNEGADGFRPVRHELDGAIATGADFQRDSDGKRHLLVTTTTRFFLFEFPEKGAEPIAVRAADNVYQGKSTGVLRDLDGDGWLDAVIARNGPYASNIIVYGPLRENFEELSNEMDLLPKITEILKEKAEDAR